jgi:hypothetical protein
VGQIGTLIQLNSAENQQYETLRAHHPEQNTRYLYGQSDQGTLAGFINNLFK